MPTKIAAQRFSDAVNAVCNHINDWPNLQAWQRFQWQMRGMELRAEVRQRAKAAGVPADDIKKELQSLSDSCSPSVKIDEAVQAVRRLIHLRMYYCDDVEPQPVAIAPPDMVSTGEGDDLRDRERLILETMYAKGVTSKQAKLTRTEIVNFINPKDGVQSYAHAFADLKRKGYTNSNRGADAGIWLTAKGVTAGKENLNSAQ